MGPAVMGRALGTLCDALVGTLALPGLIGLSVSSIPSVLGTWWPLFLN